MRSISFPRIEQKWFRLACFVIAMVAQFFVLRLALKVETENYTRLQSIRAQTGYELHMENATGQGNETILSYEASDEHDHLVTLKMENASLSKESQALPGLANLSRLSGKLLYAPDTSARPIHGKSCRTSFAVEFQDQSGKREHSVVLYPPGPDEFKQLDRWRTVHLRSESPLVVRISANSQNGEAGPNCRNVLSIGKWEQAIGKDVELAFVAAPNSEVTLRISSDPKTEDGFRRGKDEFESLELEPLHPALLAISPAGVNRLEQVRKRAGSPLMTVTNLRLGGDFLEVDLSGLIGLPVSDLLGGGKWPLLAFVNTLLLIWAGKTFRFGRSAISPPASMPSGSAPASGRMRLFLSYSWGDRDRVMRIYNLLEAAGVEPWIDRKEIRGGADWELSIKQQMRDSQRVLIFLSCASIQKAGYAWAEIRLAARVAEEQPEGTPFIIPVTLDHCRIPDLLSRWNSIELDQPDGENRILEALGVPQTKPGTEPAKAVL